MKSDVLKYISCPMNGAKPGGRHNTVPCKLNNAKTNKHLGQLMNCLSFEYIEFKPTKILE